MLKSVIIRELRRSRVRASLYACEKEIVSLMREQKKLNASKLKMLHRWMLEK